MELSDLMEAVTAEPLMTEDGGTDVLERDKGIGQLEDELEGKKDKKKKPKIRRRWSFDDFYALSLAEKWDTDETRKSLAYDMLLPGRPHKDIESTLTSPAYSSWKDKMNKSTEQIEQVAKKLQFDEEEKVQKKKKAKKSEKREKKSPKEKKKGKKNDKKRKRETNEDEPPKKRKKAASTTKKKERSVRYAYYKPRF